ncbi:MAG: CatA-like O-acetyltransferase [Rufibacter sp.]
MTSKYNKTSIPLQGWEREEHFLFFKNFTQPFFNVHTELDITALYHFCRKTHTSIFLTYLYATLQAARSTENFRLRLEGEQVVLFDGLDLSTTLLKQNKTIAFLSLPYAESLQTFCTQARELIDAAKHSKELFIGHQGPDLLHLTTLPWFKFNGMEHATSVNPGEAGIPKIAFGRMDKTADRVILPVSVALHHALADGYHVHLFLEQMHHYISTLQV